MTEFGDLYDEELAKQVEAAEAAEAAEEASTEAGKRANDEAAMAAYEAVMKRDDNDASGLIGAHIGNLRVLRRVKPGKRPLFVCLDRRGGREVRLRGYQLVRVAREARNAGLLVTGLREPWRDEDDTSDK